MGLYSLLLGCALLLGSPYWLWRTARSRGGWGGIWQRLGRIPRPLRNAAGGRQVVWIHAVSVGEVLAAARLVAELARALGEGGSIVISTTTATGQALARQRFSGGEDVAGSGGRVFYYPLDFAWSVRAYLQALQPRMLVLMESELWPRMLIECRRAGVPVAVVNARVSDRSFRRGMRVRRLWAGMLRLVDVFLAQSEEDARRLRAMGAPAKTVRATGNLKYDAAEQGRSEVAARIGQMATGRRIVVAGSTVEGEEPAVLSAWTQAAACDPEAVLVLAPRHRERFAQVHRLIAESGYVVARASELEETERPIGRGAIVLLDTIGDLAAVYGVAQAAFVGGSLVRRGGHNPLEPARYGVPVVMGPSYENFRDIVAAMQATHGIRIVNSGAELGIALTELLTDAETARAMGARGRSVFETQQGATDRAVEILLELMRKDSRAVVATETRP